MAVCGRCLICGHKFDGDDTPDVAVKWTCEIEACAHRSFDRGPAEHGICRTCHDHLAHGSEIPQAVADLLALVIARRSS